MAANPIVRPRRASRVPARMGDENGTTIAAAAPRLVSKTSLASLGATGKLNKIIGNAVSVSAPQGKLALGTAVAQPTTRRALGDVSNAARATTVADKPGKEPLAVIVKPARARTQSATSTSAIGTGFSRLKIGTTASVPAARPLRTTSSDLKLASKASSQSLRNEERFQQEVRPTRGDEELEVLHERSLDGLGIKAPEGQDWTAHEMYGVEDQAMNVDQTRPSSSHKRQAESDSESEDEGVAIGTKVRLHESVYDDPEDWIVAHGLQHAGKHGQMLEGVSDEFDEQLDYWDTTMVAEYSEEIFKYMAELEDKAMPNPRYMDHQTEIEWSMRTTLIDWLLQVHMRYHMLPETLWIAINIVDRFLSNRVVSLVKFQLVGVTAMFVAAKYEEIMAPSVDEFVYMTEKGYTKDEIIKGERIILQSLEFNISPYCSPYSWVRRISKADDYDIQTRTLSKFLMEVTLLDHRFLRARPSMIAAIGMYLARRMLGGEWNESFIYYSNYTEAQLIVPTGYLLELISEEDFESKFVYKKYANKKFLKASIFARNWAKSNAAPNDA